MILSYMSIPLAVNFDFVFFHFTFFLLWTMLLFFPSWLLSFFSFSSLVEKDNRQDGEKVGSGRGFPVCSFFGEKVKLFTTLLFPFD